MDNETFNGPATLSTLPHALALPAEIWLQILENTPIREAYHLWSSVRHVSLRFKDLVERLFKSTYLPTFAISLSLPRRDPTTGALKWPKDPIPRAQIIMSFNCISSDQNYAQFQSPVAIKFGSETKNMEELMHDFVLTKERLRDAPPWVYSGNSTPTGVSMRVPPNIE
jgi:hypothetical protein